MARRVLLGIGIVLILLVVFLPTGLVNVVHRKATWYTTPVHEANDLDSRYEVSPDEVPSECRPLLRSLAAGNTVSIEEYSIHVGPIRVLITQTSKSDGWKLRSAGCISQMDATGLTIDNREYYIWGNADFGTSLRNWKWFDELQFVLLVVGFGCIGGSRLYRT